MKSFLRSITLVFLLASGSLIQIKALDPEDTKTVHGISTNASGEIFITDIASNQIKKIDKDGLVIVLAGSGQNGYQDGDPSQAKFNSPAGIALDALGNIYVADQRNHRIRKISNNGQVSTIAGNGVQGDRDGLAKDAMFSYPESISVLQDGRILVADKVNNKIRIISPEGIVSTLK